MRKRKLCRAVQNVRTRDAVLTELRREILAARLKVSLDKRRGRETNEAVMFLSSLELPPLSN